MYLLLPACSQRVVGAEQSKRKQKRVPHTERSAGYRL